MRFTTDAIHQFLWITTGQFYACDMAFEFDEQRISRLQDTKDGGSWKLQLPGCVCVHVWRYVSESDC
jgi:hypothetical protein